MFKGPNVVVVSEPSFVLVWNYVYHLRKSAMNLINDRMDVDAAFVQAQRDTNVKERFFTTPVAADAIQSHLSARSVSGPSNSRGRNDGRGRSRSPDHWRQQAPRAKGAKGKGKGGKGKGAKGKGIKGKAATETPDKRPICFAWNSAFEKCRGGCGRVHCCRLCFDEGHPMHLHDISVRRVVENHGWACCPPKLRKGFGGEGA